MNVAQELTQLSEAAKVKAVNSGVHYGNAVGRINGRQVEAAALYVKRSHRVTWTVDGRRCAASNLLTTLA